jgi:serine/threonine protein kinase
MELVSKILPSAQATKEKARIDLLPDELNGNLYYKYAKLCSIPESNKFYDPAKSNLIMQFIDGIELSEFLDNFKNTENQTNRWNSNYKNKDRMPVIPLPIAIILLESIYNMYPLLLRLNRKYNIYHNDISTTNMMYNESTGKMVLIDFGMTNTACNDPFNNIKSTNQTCDIKSFFDTLAEIFDVLFYNEQINHHIIEHFPSWMNQYGLNEFTDIYIIYMKTQLKLSKSRKIYTEIDKNPDKIVEYDMHNDIFMAFVQQIISKLREL